MIFVCKLPINKIKGYFGSPDNGLFLAYFSLWSVIHSNRVRYIFSWTMNVTSQGVIFTVPQICAYFLDNTNNLEIDSFIIAVSEHILLYFKNSNSFFVNEYTYPVEVCGMSTCRKWKYTMRWDSIHKVCHTLSCVHIKKTVWILKI
jgi:hypothetical protein